MKKKYPILHFSSQTNKKNGSRWSIEINQTTTTKPYPTKRGWLDGSTDAIMLYHHIPLPYF